VVRFRACRRQARRVGVVCVASRRYAEHALLRPPSPTPDEVRSQRCRRGTGMQYGQKKVVARRNAEMRL